MQKLIVEASAGDVLKVAPPILSRVYNQLGSTQPFGGPSLCPLKETMRNIGRISIHFSIKIGPATFKSIDLANAIVLVRVFVSKKQQVVRPRTCWDVDFSIFQ